MRSSFMRGIARGMFLAVAVGSIIALIFALVTHGQPVSELFYKVAIILTNTLVVVYVVFPSARR